VNKSASGFLEAKLNYKVTFIYMVSYKVVAYFNMFSSGMLYMILC